MNPEPTAVPSDEKTNVAPTNKSLQKSLILAIRASLNISMSANDLVLYMHKDLSIPC
jgi:hypothetical protein